MLTDTRIKSIMHQKPKDTPKQCRLCADGVAISGEKYCKTCKKSVLKELKESGYLSSVKPPSTINDQRGRKARSSEMLGGAAELGTDGDD